MESGSTSPFSCPWQRLPKPYAKGSEVRRDWKVLRNSLQKQFCSELCHLLAPEKRLGSTVQRVHVLDLSLICSVAPLIFQDIQLDCNFWRTHCLGVRIFTQEKCVCVCVSVCVCLCSCVQIDTHCMGSRVGGRKCCFLGWGLLTPAFGKGLSVSVEKRGRPVVLQLFCPFQLGKIPVGSR